MCIRAKSHGAPHRAFPAHEKDTGPPDIAMDYLHTKAGGARDSEATIDSSWSTSLVAVHVGTFYPMAEFVLPHLRWWLRTNFGIRYSAPQRGFTQCTGRLLDGLRV